MKTLNFEQIFASIGQNPEFKKYLLLGGFVHLFLSAVYVLSIFAQAISESYFILFNVLDLLVYFFLFGFFVDTIRRNITSDDATKFEFSDFNILKRFWDGFVFNLLCLLPLVVLLLFLGLILVVPSMILASASSDSYAGVGVIIVMVIAVILGIFLCAVLYPQIITNYLNKGKILAVCDFKVFFNMYKQNPGASIVVALMTIIFSMLWCIPFIGFYFDMVWANMYAQYARIVKD